MNIAARLNVSRSHHTIAFSHDWESLGGWIETVADETIPLDDIFHLTHLVTYGWVEDLAMLEGELQAVLAQDTLPERARQVVHALAGVVAGRSARDERIEVRQTSKILRVSDSARGRRNDSTGNSSAA